MGKAIPMSRSAVEKYVPKTMTQRTPKYPMSSSITAKSKSRVGGGAGPLDGSKPS